MKIALCIVYVLIVLAVVVWLLYELRADKREPYQPTVPAPRERLPPKDDV